MNKAELVKAIAEQTNLTKKEAEAAVVAFMDIVKNEVAGHGSVQLIGFGTFDSTMRAPRTARNPRTGETIEVPSQRVPKFKPGAAFKDAVR